MMFVFIQILSILICFSFIYLNHIRISNIQFNNDDLIMDTKKKINALNTILLRKYEKKQRIDSQIMNLIVKKLDSLESKLSDKDNTLESEIHSLKKTLSYLQDQKTLFYEFDEEAL